MGAFGPVYEGEGDNKKPVMKTINYVDFMESGSIDGTLISEVRQGRDGVSIKFHDKMKALEKLDKYLDLLPDHHKRMIEEEKLKLETEEHQVKIETMKVQLDKIKSSDGDGDIAETNRPVNLSQLSDEELVQLESILRKSANSRRDTNGES
jgi:phage terminase small subunit